MLRLLFFITVLMFAGRLEAISGKVAMRVAGPDDKKGEFSSRFKVLDRPGKLYASYVRPDAKFIRNPALMSACYNAEYLKVYVTCPVPDGMKPTGGVQAWQGDAVELFIKPRFDSSVYYQYVINADNKTAAFKFSGPGVQIEKWKSKAEFKLIYDKYGFVVKIFIPRSELPEIDWESGNIFAANVIRSGETAGGKSCWSKVTGSHHNPDTFGVWIINSRKDYVEKKLKPMLPKLAKISSKELDDLVKEIRANADIPAKWADVMSQIGRLEFLLAQRSIGKAAFIWDAPVWGNKFQPGINTRPLKKLVIKAPVNCKTIHGVAFSNCTGKNFMGQLKYFSDASRKYLQNEFWKNPFDEPGMAVARRISICEGIPLTMRYGGLHYDPLVPLPLNTLIRCAPYETKPLFISVDTKGLKPGKYTGFFMLKPSVPGFTREEIRFDLEVVDLDLAEVHLDNYVWEDYLSVRPIHLRENVTKFLTSYEINVLRIRIGNEVDGLPVIDKDGNILELDFSRLDYLIDFYCKSGIPKERLKLLIGYGHHSRGPLIKGTEKRVPLFSPAWNKAITEWTKRFVKHLEVKHGIGKDRMWFYPVDEPGGDPNDPKSWAYMAIKFAKFYKAAVPGVKVWGNPYDWNTTDQAKKILTGLGKELDTLCPSRGHLKNQDFIDIAHASSSDLWTYSVPNNTAHPEFYRALNWMNVRDNIQGPAAFWVFDHFAGGDGFDQYDGVENPVDYGVAYMDLSSDKAISSRRLESFYQGILDRKIVILCQRYMKKLKAQGKECTAAEKELQKIIAEGCRAGSTEDYAKLRSTLIDLTLSLKKQIKK